ncbi:MAG: sensor histidine kinase [Chromatiales bacterium]|nr:sensor histidine kinase [Chromatiales bacterium]
MGVLLLCIAFGTKADVAQPARGEVSINGSLTEIALMPSARTVKDPDNKLTAEGLLKLPETPDEFMGKRIASFFFTDAVYWFQVSIKNTDSTPLQRLLVFDQSWLDDVQITLIVPDGTTRLFKGGDLLPFQQRTVSHRNINFELLLPPGESQLFVRVKTRDPYLVGMTLWERSAFFESNISEAHYYGFFYGVVVVMLLYNLMLYISIREPIYATYVVYILSFIVGTATYNGHTYPLLWPDYPIWSNWAHSIFIYLYMFAGLIFTIHFLELRSKLPHAYRLAKALIIIMLVSFVLTAILGGYRWHISSSILWIVVYSLFALWMGVISLLSGNRSARFFLIGTTACLVGSAITALTVSAVIPYSFYTFHAPDFGMMLDAVMLSFALADRLRIARAETEQARVELLEVMVSDTEKLESRVVQRTLELKEANATKDKFFSIIAHDLRGPIGSLSALFNDVVLSIEDLTDDTLQAVRTTTKNTHNFLEQLLTWARSQKGEISYTPEAIELSQIFKELQELFSAQAQTKGVKLDLKIDGPYWIIADLAMANTILRNLISNALKYTDRDDSISASVEEEGNHYRINIEDSGIGMDHDTQKMLFHMGTKPQSTLGTKQESGTGLGLILCSEFVEQNHGTIGVKSEKGEGTTFWFTLPKG